MLGTALRKGFSFQQTGGDWRSLFSSSHTVAGVSVSPATSLRAAAVYSATSLIAQTIASLPVRFVLRDDTSRTPQRPDVARPVWDRPNPIQTPSALMESVVMSQLLWGNSYIYPRRDRAGRIVELWPVDPDRVDMAETFETPAGDVGVRFRVVDMGDLDNVPGQPVALIHIPHITLPGRVKGVSPIEQLAELVGMSLSSQEHAARFLGEGIHMAGVIESPGNLDGAKARELTQSFRQIYGGPKNSGKVGVLTGGASFRQLSIPPAELQFLEQMQYSDQKIASIFRVPPHMVGDVNRSTSWGTGIEEQTIQFVQHTLLPVIRKIEESFERTLLAGSNYEMRFQVNGLLRGNIAARSAFYSALWNIGALSDDDIRAFEDLPPIPDGAGSTYYVPLNMTPAGQDADTQRNALIDALRGGR